MASGSPRGRIDQFFGAKKRKAQSPGLKSGRGEKDARTAVEVSPRAKGTLDNYLVASQDDERTLKPSHAGHGPSTTQDTVKRNLASEINLSKYVDQHAPLLAQGSCQTFELSGEAQKESCRYKASDLSVEGTSKGCSLSAQGAENSELKQFAADFLSLYCSELQTSQSSRKGNDSQSVLVDDMTSNSRHCISDHDQFKIEGVITCPKENIPEGIRSGFIVETGKAVFSCSREVMVGSNVIEHQASLRKCNNMPNSTVNMIECHTPASLNVNAHASETPKSMRGSSIFSPGEAFWNEAIQVADGLLGPTDDFCVLSSEKFNTAKIQYERNNSHNLRCGSCDNNTKELQDEGESRILHMEMVASSKSLGKHGKTSGVEASPLPVKHFDFSLDDKSFDQNTPYECSADETKAMRDRGNKQIECGSVNHKGLWVADHLTSGNAQMNGEHKVKDMPSIHAVTKREKVHVLREDSGSITPDAPGMENRNVIASHAYNEASTPSSFPPPRDRLDLSNWLPSEVCSIYRKSGISKLYPWQVDCLQVDGVLHRRNLVYCASTSAGKSFVAEILMLRRVLSTGKMALLVLPYVSICTEKAEHLEILLEPIGKHVRSYYGNQGGGTLPKDTSVVVCTIEKANSLINRLLEEGRLSEIGIIVIDELHMVGDQSRGYLLELMLTKLRYATGEGNADSYSGESSGTSSGKTDPAQGLQIVGMSATMPNVQAVADWLQAALYQTDFRPVPLEEYIKVGNVIYNKRMEIVRTISKAADLGGKDPDHIVELCNEVVQDGHSVLLFCPSRKGCESTARHISRFLTKFSVNMREDKCEFIDTNSAIDALRKCPAGLDPILEETLSCGVAYHHAGLTVEEREIVETCYRKGLVRVLTATSTLAAGVNLPARRVIFRQPRIGRDFIDGTRYKQMAGRAGRTGIDTKGESVLVCKPEELKRIIGLLNESCPLLLSCLSEDKNGMTHAILEVVAGGIVQTANDIHRYVRCTLLNSTKPFQDVVKSAQDSLRWLCHRKFLEWNEDTKLYSTTPLGRAAFGSSLSPEESLIVLDDLSRAREGFVLASDLHLVYLVTPINVDMEPDWELYYERFVGLSAIDQSVGNRVGVVEPFLMRMAHGAPLCSSNRSGDNKRGFLNRLDNRHRITNNIMLSIEHSIRVCKRFYVALILSRLVQEAPVVEVCEAFKVARGMVQALQENAGRFASMVSVFCERLGWHDLEGLVAKFQNRVSFGVRPEVVELTTIPYVKGSRARALYKAGLRTPLAIAEAAIPEIVKALFESSSWAAHESAQRHMQFGIAKKIKNGARKIVLDKAEEARVAAFSAFKSLGLNVPQFSRPLLATSAGNSTGHEGATNSSGDDTTSSFVGIKHKEPVLAKPSIEGCENYDNIAPDIEGKKPTKISDIRLGTSAEVSSSAVMQCNSGDGNPAVGDALDPADDHTKNVETISVLGNYGNGNKVCDGSLANGAEKTMQELSGRENVSPDKKDRTHNKGPMNAANIPGGFDSFLDLWESTQNFYFDIHFNKQSGLNSAAPFELHGIAICWENSPVYYVNLPKDLLWSHTKKDDYLPITSSSDKKNDLSSNHLLETANRRWNRIGRIMVKKDVKKFTWNLKIPIQVFKIPAVSIQRFGGLNHAARNMGLELVDNLYFILPPISLQGVIDMCIVAWILWPDEERSSCPNLEKEVKKRLSGEAAAAAHRSGRWRNQMRKAAHNGCCRRVAQIRALCSVLWKLLVSEELVEALMSIEIPLVNVLADMEVWGIGVDMDGCLQARHVLGKKLKCLEKEAYNLAGMTFSLYTAADIANVLYGHLKLPMPEGCNKGKQHPSTDKHCLDSLRNEHPIVPVIKEHRTLAKLMNCTLGSICSLARLSARTQKYTLHGHWLQTTTATGRLSMEEPNLQCVEHMVDFKMKNNDQSGVDPDADSYKINAREFFVPTQENWLLLTADYSQIELRLMAHFSNDSSLIELLSKPQGDVFTMIAARWTGKLESTVSCHERVQTKRLVYGILYGMGANTVAEQLDCTSDEAAEKIQSFKSSFPGVAAWLCETIASCRQKGYVMTLRGRKRFLSKIKLGNSKEKSKAQRQAVNSICQIAMINIYSVIVEGVEMPNPSSAFAAKFQMLKNRCRILLQVHDELVLEVDPSVIEQAGSLLQVSMERAASLLVPLHVKLKVGRTWGSLEPFQSEECKDEVLVPRS
ncbi:helicase and polymerase-containing protein TEBICHI isoform X2 [Malania oleifera]|uniref:helicase and polymerase-containing protein TEBICHI isoform X2 n=1 Tax=Malania oleifera TaxID=397392 RepID=UPI0025AEA05C|nr:helicase and polymerase-containing protein TEBICHI isoform X2 [Malania oleifera]